MTRELLVNTLTSRMNAIKLEGSLTRLNNLTKTLQQPRVSNYLKIPQQIQLKRRIRQPEPDQEQLMQEQEQQPQQQRQRKQPLRQKHYRNQLTNAQMAKNAERDSQAWTASGLKHSDYEANFAETRSTIRRKQRENIKRIEGRRTDANEKALLSASKTRRTLEAAQEEMDMAQKKHFIQTKLTRSISQTRGNHRNSRSARFSVSNYMRKLREQA